MGRREAMVIVDLNWIVVAVLSSLVLCYVLVFFVVVVCLEK